MRRSLLAPVLAIPVAGPVAAAVPPDSSPFWTVAVHPLDTLVRERVAILAPPAPDRDRLLMVLDAAGLPQPEESTMAPILAKASEEHAKWWVSAGPELERRIRAAESGDEPRMSLPFRAEVIPYILWTWTDGLCFEQDALHRLLTTGRILDERATEYARNTLAAAQMNRLFDREPFHPDGPRIDPDFDLVHALAEAGLDARGELRLRLAYYSRERTGLVRRLALRRLDVAARSDLAERAWDAWEARSTVTTVNQDSPRDTHASIAELRVAVDRWKTLPRLLHCVPFAPLLVEWKELELRVVREIAALLRPGDAWRAWVTVAPAIDGQPTRDRIESLTRRIAASPEAARPGLEASLRKWLAADADAIRQRLEADLEFARMFADTIAPALTAEGAAAMDPDALLEAIKKGKVAAARSRVIEIDRTREARFRSIEALLEASSAKAAP